MKLFILVLCGIFVSITFAHNIVKRQEKSCKGPDLKAGVCVGLTECPKLFQKLQQNPDDEDFALFLRLSNKACEMPTPIICCPKSLISPNAVFINKLPTEDDNCGYVDNSFRRIIGGQKANLGAWPWIALLGYINNLDETSYKCGGALITSRHVITAAHCIDINLRFVRLGEHDLSITTEAKHVDINIVKNVAHPQYDRKDGHSDIGILFMEKNAPFSEFIWPICLPTSQQFRTKSYIGYNPYLAGWGRTEERGETANILQEVQLPILENNKCKEKFEAQDRLISAKQFNEAVICSGVLSGGKDTCYGDSGGPLMIPENTNRKILFFLHGVISYGVGCGRENVPGVYTSIPYFLDWIEKEISDTT